MTAIPPSVYRCAACGGWMSHPESSASHVCLSQTESSIQATEVGFTVIPAMPYVDHGYDEASKKWAVSFPGAPACIAQGDTLSDAVHALALMLPWYLEKALWQPGQP